LHGRIKIKKYLDSSSIKPQTLIVMKQLFLLITAMATLVLTGCGGAFDNNYNKAVNAYKTGNYTVTVWSGGKAVKTYHIKNGFVNSEKESDGWFFFSEGKLVRLSGTVTIEQE
jgi:hypothetical protein